MPVGALSGGMYKKLAIACALLHRPRALVLDEPTNGVDPVSRRELWALLHDFVREGMGVLVSTPYMDEAARCDRVALLHAGHVLREGPPHRLLADFEHVVLAIHGVGRTQIDQILDHHPAVMAVTPAGEAIRAVVRVDGAQPVREAMAKVGGQADPVLPDFEDLVLSILVQSRGDNP